MSIDQGLRSCLKFAQVDSVANYQARGRALAKWSDARLVEAWTVAVRDRDRAAEDDPLAELALRGIEPPIDDAIRDILDERARAVFQRLREIKASDPEEYRRILMHFPEVAHVRLP
jgi:hypothetical protein